MADEAVRPDVHKSLAKLQDEWSDCTACDLGALRQVREAPFVFGRGATRGLMLIGESLTASDESSEQLFSGKAGALLGKVLTSLGVDRFYLTNLVVCRACTPQTDAQGQPIVRRDWKTKQPMPVYKDEPPTPPQYKACLARLHEEIYLVDPVIIIGFGPKVCEALTGGPVNLMKDRGEPIQIDVPGASFLPVLTEKKQEWIHRTKDGLRTLNEQMMVRYLLMPTFSPSYVLRKIADEGADSPFQHFINDIKRAFETYERHHETVHRMPLSPPSDFNDSLLQHELQASQLDEEYT